MNIPVGLLGQVILAFGLLMVALTAYLAIKKTDSPWILTIVSVVLIVLPPFNLLLVVVLALKSAPSHKAA